jgi:hypothetical protein
MAQRMGMSGVNRPFIEDPSNIAGAEALAVGIQEQRNPGFVPDNLEARFQPVTNGLDRGKRHWDSAFFATLTPHRDNTSLEVDTVNVEIAKFAHTQSASVQNFEQCIIAAAAPQGFAFVNVNWLKQRLQLGPIKNSRQTTFARRRAQRHSGIDFNQTGASCPREISSQRRGLACDAALGIRTRTEISQIPTQN